MAVRSPTAVATLVRSSAWRLRLSQCDMAGPACQRGGVRGAPFNEDEFWEKRVVRSTLFKRLCCAMIAALSVAGLGVSMPAAAKPVAAAKAVVPTAKPAVLDDEEPAADETAAEAAPQDGSAAEPAPPAAETLEVKGPASIVVDLATGKVLSEHDATERRYPASTTKLMTAYLALKALRAGTIALDSPIIVTRNAAAQAPSKMGYAPGTVIRLDNALKMMLVKSANDIAVAIGDSLAHGREEDFVTMMNGAAVDLGMKDTIFINPNGLPGEGQRSSAKDLALLAVAIRREFPAFSGYFDIEAITNGRSIMKNGNKLIGRFDGADGMKTGYICASGFNLVSSATREGRTLVAVVLGANGTIARERLAAAILQAGFETDPAAKTKTIEDLPAASGDVVDISDFICGSVGRSARFADRAEEKNREQMYGSPYLTEMQRPPVTVKIGIGGAAGNDLVEPGVSIIANYGIPIPTPRPTPPPAETVALDETVPSTDEDMTTQSTGGLAPAPAEAAQPLAPAAVPAEPKKPSAANAYTGDAGKNAAPRFPLGVRSEMAKRGPRLNTDVGFDLRPAAFGRPRPEAPAANVN